ncbi:MAG TPA: hypothetical protein PLQ41_04910 [bacterium]|nr:hypothetical protein [bacterium]
MVGYIENSLCSLPLTLSLSPKGRGMKMGNCIEVRKNLYLSHLHTSPHQGDEIKEGSPQKEKGNPLLISIPHLSIRERVRTRGLYFSP